jgi:hypothetical protein
VELRDVLGIHLAAQVILASLRLLGRSRVTPATADRLDRALVAIIFFGANAALLATAPIHGDFSWSDAPRHALNGAFVKDFIAAAPWHDPKTWAVNYYLQYPALTVLFYPPLFYFFEALAFAVFGSAIWWRRRPSARLQCCSGRQATVLSAQIFRDGRRSARAC